MANELGLPYGGRLVYGAGSSQNSPVVKGTNLTTSNIATIAMSYTPFEITTLYSGITEEDVGFCLDFERKKAELRQRALDVRLEYNPTISSICPIIKGTTITTREIATLRVQGELDSAILIRLHPGLIAEDIRLAVEYESPNINTIRDEVLEASANEIDEESDTDGLVDDFLEANNLYRFEGDQGLDNFSKLLEAIGYKETGFKYGSPIESFLSSCPGAVLALIEWIKDQNLPEWKTALQQELHESAPEEDQE